MNETPPNANNPKELPEFSTRKLLILSLVSVNVYVFFSLLIIRFWHDSGLAEVLIGSFSLWIQLGIGLGTGILSAAIIYVVISFTSVSGVLSDYFIFEALSKSEFSFFDKAQISLFAGAGEEFLFRGAIQPLLGNGLTSFIFIAIHGYFKFTSYAHMAFGIMMFTFSLILGLLSSYVGLFSAMAAHAIYDFLMLYLVQKKYRS